MNILDELRILVWQNTKNGKNGTNIPESVYKKLCFQSEKKTEEKDIMEYEKTDDFDSMWNKLKGHKNG